MATGDVKFPGLDQKYVQEIEQRTANVPAGAKEMLQQRMYSDFYAQQQREKEQQERLTMKNEITNRELNTKSGGDKGAKLQLKKGNLADAIRNFYKLNVSDGDDDTIVSKFTDGIKNGNKMYVDYLNGDNNDIMIQTGLLGDTAKKLYNLPGNRLNPQNSLTNQNIASSVIEAQKKTQPTATLSSTSHFDDPEYAADYINKAPEEYKKFIEESRKAGKNDTWIASVIDGYQVYTDKLQKYEDFENRDRGERGQEVAVGIPQGFVNFFANAYNNLFANNPNIGLTHGKNIDMDKIQFTDDLLGTFNNYGDLRAESGWTKTGEFGGEMGANVLLFHYLPMPGEGVKLESIAESTLKEGTKGALKNIGNRMVYGAAEGAGFGELASIGQEDVTGTDVAKNIALGGGIGSVFGLFGAGVNAWKYRNTLKTLAKEGDKEGTIKGLLDMYNRGVKPSSQGVKTNTQLQQYNDDAMGAVESIIKNKNALKYIDANGEETFGHLPRSVDEFSQAIKQTKQSIYDRYASIAKDAGHTTNVDTTEIVDSLKKQLNNKEWRAGQSEATIAKMEKWIKDLEELNNTMSVEGAQAKVQELNQRIQAFLKSQNPNDVSPNAVDGLVLNGLKKGIDDAIEKAGLDSEEYIQLRNMYRQLRSIESDVNHRAVVYGRQNPQSLIDSMSDLQTIDAIADIFSNPVGGTIKLLKTKAFKTLAKDRNDSNKIVDKMFSQADDTISKTDTLKSQTQIANERTQRQQYNIRKSRQQRLEEAKARQEQIKSAKQAILDKQAEQEAAYQEYLKGKGVGSETQALPQKEGVSYSTYIADDGAPIMVTPEGTAVRQGQIAEIPQRNKTRQYIIDNLKKYKDAKAEYDTFLDEMASDLDGVALKPDLKIENADGTLREDGIKRVLEKATDKSNGVDGVTDIVRGTTAVKDAEGMQKAIDWLNNKGIKFDDKFSQPTGLGYKDLSFLHETSNGVKAEVQINTPEMLVAKEGENAIKMGVVDEAGYKAIVDKAGVEGGKGHKYYKEWRDIKEGVKNGDIDPVEGKAKMDKIAQESRDYYSKFDNLGKKSGNVKIPEYNGISKEIIDNGGITLDVLKKRNLGGEPYVAVSPYPNRSKIIKVSDFTDESVAEYFEANADKLFEDGYVLGGRVNDGNVYLDVSIALPKEMQKEAVEIANRYNQKAIFDLETFEDIPTAGNGEFMDVDEAEISKYIKSLFNKSK